MSTWKLRRGEDFAIEGTVTFSTVAGGALLPLDLTGATLTWHMGSVLSSPIYTRIGATSFTHTVATLGVYQFTLSPIDTENLAATTYLFDMWVRTPAAKEYCLTVGTFVINDVIGTI